MKKRTNMLKIIIRQLRLIKKRKKSYLYLIYFLNMIAGGLLPVFAPFIPRIVIDNMVAGRDFGEIFRKIIIIVGLSMVLAITTVICDRIKFVQFIDLRMAEFYDLNDRFLKLNYEHLEDPSFQDRCKRQPGL